MNWPPTFKRSDRLEPKAFDVAWTSENFDIVINFCINYSSSMESRYATLLCVDATEARVDCRGVLWYMLYAMYLQQSREEQQAGVTINKDGIGFNRFDDNFLSGIAQRNYSAGLMSNKETYYVARSLKKYKRQIMNLSNPVKKTAKQLELPIAIDRTYSV